MLTITLARDAHKAAPDRGFGTRFRRGDTASLTGEVVYPGKPWRSGGASERWSLADCDDIDWMYIFNAEDVAGLEAPDTPAWRALSTEHVPPFPVTYRPPVLTDQEPDGSYCLPEPPPAFQLGDVIRVARPEDYDFTFPGPWQGEVIETRYYRSSGDYSYRIRLERGAVWTSDRHLAMYGCRLALVERADLRDEEDQPQ
jgi:hypothetical protein